MNLEIKTATPGLSWLVYENDVKIAAVHKTDEGFIVAQQGNIVTASSPKAVRKRLGISIDWEPEDKIQENLSKNDLDGYTPDTETYYDPMIEVKRRLPLYTKVPGSKCYFAAGWYRILFGNKTKVEFCPKLLTLNRNKFWGPFHSQDEAESLNQ